LQAIEQHFSLKKALIDQEQDLKTVSASHQGLRRSLEERISILKASLAKDSKELEQRIVASKALNAQKAAFEKSNSSLAILSNTCCGGISHGGLRETIWGKYHAVNYSTPCRHTIYK
jgi:hypothetical protein